MAQLTLPSAWPFDVRRLPFFYGWAIWLVSTVGLWMTVPGQTMGMAVFTDSLIIELGLSRTQLSTAYMLGTVGSSLYLTQAGRLFDRYGARTMLVCASVALGVCVVYITLIGPLARLVAGWTPFALAYFTFPLIVVGYFGVRLTGQGVLAGANRNVLLVWFERRRGLVSGARGVFMSLGFSLAPLMLAALIDGFGWRGALWVLAAATGIGFALVALVFARDTPESCGLLPDGDVPVASRQMSAAPSTAALNATLAEAKRSTPFWIYSLSLATYSLTGTAVTFHIVDIFEAVGRGRAEAFGYFLPLATMAVMVNLLASWGSDRCRLKPLLLTMLLGFLLGSFGLTVLDSAWGYWVVVTGYGIGSGLWAVLSNLTYVRFFGRLHLGEISGLAVSMSVVGSAIGPALFSVGKDLTGAYTAPAWFCFCIFVVLLFAAMRVEEPDKVR
ncbi:MAG: MFS transporter [Chromatiales bacterium]|jgi:MFS transporter, OFA family, oxalate/formate antiporter|nr:MFS transporter [Chromatiales bacterium]